MKPSRCILYITLSILFCLNAIPIRADMPEELTLKKAFALAYAESPQWKAKQMDFYMDLGDVRTARLFDNPTFWSDSGIAEKTYRVGIKQTIPMGPRRKHQAGLAIAELNVTQDEIETTWLNLKKEIRNTYVHLYLAQKKEDAFKEVENNLQHLAQVLKEKSVKDCMQLELLKLQVLDKIQAASIEIFQEQSKLNTLLNKPLTQQWNLLPPEFLTKKDNWMETLIEEALVRHPEIKQNQHEADVTKEEMALAKSKRIPDLTLTVGPDWVTQPDQRKVGAFFTTATDIPIFNRNQGQIQKYTARLTQLEYEQVALKNKIRMQVVNAYVAFEETRKQLEHYQQIIKPKSKELLKLAQKELESGESDIDDVLDVHSTDIEVSTAHFKAIQQYHAAISELEQSVGRSLDD